MDYIDRVLAGGETLVCRGRVHPIVFLWPSVWAGLALCFWAFGGDLAGVGGIFLLFAVVSGFGAYIFYLSSVFAVTDRHLVFKVGFIRREGRNLSLAQIEVVEIEQGVLGRMLSYGTVKVVGSGGTVITMKPVAHPVGFRREIQNQLVPVQIP